MESNSRSLQVKPLLLVEPLEDCRWGDRFERVLDGTDWRLYRSSPADARHQALSTAALVVVVTEAALAVRAGLVSSLAGVTRAPVAVAGRGDAAAEVSALHAGAAAYLRSEQPDELLLERLEALVRRHPFRAALGRLPQRLGPQERALAHAILAHRGPLDRQRAVEVLWCGFASESTFRVGLHRLRRRLEAAGLLLDVRPGLGVRILAHAQPWGQPSPVPVDNTTRGGEAARSGHD